MCATMWRRRTACARNATSRWHRCATRCSMSLNPMCRRPTCRCPRAWTGTGISPGPSRASSMRCSAACRSPGRTTGTRRRWMPRASREACPGNRSCSMPTPNPKGMISSASAAWISARTAVGCCMAWTSKATNATTTAFAIWNPARNCLKCSRAFPAHASRPTRSGCSIRCLTMHGGRARYSVTGWARRSIRMLRCSVSRTNDSGPVWACRSTNAASSSGRGRRRPRKC